MKPSASLPAASVVLVPARAGRRRALVRCLVPALLLAAACQGSATSDPAITPSGSTPGTNAPAPGGGAGSSDSATTGGSDEGGMSGTSRPVPAGAVVLDDATPPLGTDAPGFATVAHPVNPSALFGTAKTPLPTNAFWENLALGAGDQRIALLPYQVRGLATGLAVGLPGVDVAAAGASTAVVVDVSLGASEGFQSHAVTSFDDLSATLTYASAAGSMTAPLVAGAAYVTAKYKGLTPHLGSERAILTINGKPDGPITSNRFELAMNSGQTWIVYTSAAITLQKAADGVAATAPFTGTLRVAMAPTAEAAAALDTYRNAVPVSAKTSTVVAADTVRVSFAYTTEGDGNPLVYALPHHIARLTTPKTVQALTTRTLKGPAVAVAGKAWELTYATPAVAFTAPRAIDPTRKDAVVAALAADKAFVPDATAVSQDPYFGGKQLAKLARLALIAEELGDATTASALLDRLTPLVVAWLDGTNGNPLRYDTVWGGVVTTHGVADPGADFGQGYYNNHHFHYGYHAYAAAVLAHARPAFATAQGKKVLWLLRDIANPSTKDPYFPRFRHHDAFAGHSWANGLFALGDNRNQESSAEAVHAWYAVALFGQATGNLTVEAIGKSLLAQEIAAAQTYYQIRKDSTVYDAPLKAKGVVGNLWSTKVDYPTFFGANPEYVFGIQMLPFTPVTESLLAKEWISDVGPLLTTAATTAAPSWGGLLTMATAVTDKQGAWAKVAGLTVFDDGNSKTNSLYWVATRP